MGTCVAQSESRSLEEAGQRRLGASGGRGARRPFLTPASPSLPSSASAAPPTGLPALPLPARQLPEPGSCHDSHGRRHPAPG